MSADRGASYERVARFYDGLARVLSLDAIGRLRRRQARGLRGGERVLYVGIGDGADALLAARLGARVSGVDVSARMLGRARTRFAREGLEVQLECRNVMDGVRAPESDVVVANFVLNVFGPEAVARVMQQLADTVRPGGSLLIGDFTPQVRARSALRWAEWAYYWPLALAAGGLGLCALHSIYDYVPLAERTGLRLVAREGFAMLPGGAEVYESLRFEKRRGG